METPSSTTKRVTRSQTLLALNNNSNNNIPTSRKVEDSEKGVSISRRGSGNQQQQQDRSALIDITNDSPIVGLAMGSLRTPSSATAKQRSNKFRNNNVVNTPGSGSGEALLRGQVKTLLQKVEEEAVLSKISLENRPFLHLQGFLSSPMGLLAPTPANTPQVPNLNEDSSTNKNEFAPFTPLPVIEEQPKICQVVSEILNGNNNKQESPETQKSLTRSLLLDFSEKSEVTDSSSECSSVVTSAYDEGKGKSSPSIDDDSSSNWSIQVNVSIHDQDEEEQLIKEGEEEVGYCYDDDYEEGDYDYDYDEGLVADLCEGIGKISVSENEFRVGKHIRFVYNSDEEIVEEEEVLHMKGLPTPKGKHLRFQ